MSKDAWKRFVERDAVLAENAPPSPVWNRNVPRCHEACPYHDGKRCELIGIRAPETCEPVAEALGNLVEERWEKMHSDPVEVCDKCGRPRGNHNARHMFVARKATS